VSLVAVGRRRSYSIINTGNVPLMYGFDCAIAWRRRRRWIPLPMGGWVVAVGKLIKPGQRGDLETYELTEHFAQGDTD
jgi:hypothetical protein